MAFVAVFLFATFKIGKIVIHSEAESIRKSKLVSVMRSKSSASRKNLPAAYG
jgi:hypothetical protein